MLPSCITFCRECWEARRFLQSFSIKLCVRYYPYDWCASSTMYLKIYFLVGIPSQFQALQKAKLRRWDNPKCRRHVFTRHQKLHTNKLKCFYGIKVAPLFLCKSKYESRWHAYWCWNDKKDQREIPSADLAQTIIKPVTVTDGFSHVDQVIMTIMTVNDSSNKGINPE